MNTGIAGIVLGLLVTGAPGLAQESGMSKPVAAALATESTHRAPAKKPAAKKSRIAAAAATSQPTDDHTGTVTRRKHKSAARAGHAAALPAAYAAIPEAERLSVQSELALLGDIDATDAKDLDQRTLAAIKAFQQRHGGKPTGILNDDERAALAQGAKGREDAVGWRVVDDTATGARLGLPTKLVPHASIARVGSRWTSPHDQIQVETFRLHDAALPALFDEQRRTQHRAVEYSELKPDSFAISGMQGLKKFIVRVQADGNELRGISILYDQATEGTVAPVALAMADTFQGFPDPHVAPPSGRRRNVEYATAIVVSREGQLLTLKQVTDNCQTITIPGFGHAERVTDDSTTDLALLRLYGARNLKAAALAGDDGNSDNLTLVGIADPLAQNGAGTVSSAPAHVTAQGIEPAPALGFSGAAAFDAQGRFAGMVDLHSPVFAGTESATRQATLVPATAVRAFLRTQGIAPATGHAAMDQSIVRVICVRE